MDTESNRRRRYAYPTVIDSLCYYYMLRSNEGCVVLCHRDCTRWSAPVVVDSDGALARLVHLEITREFALLSSPFHWHVYLLRFPGTEVVRSGSKTRMLRFNA